jgi:hypothetical protein
MFGLHWKRGALNKIAPSTGALMCGIFARPWLSKLNFKSSKSSAALSPLFGDLEASSHYSARWRVIGFWVCSLPRQVLEL